MVLPLLLCMRQLSDMDARVLDDLLGDPLFLESLREQGVPLQISDAVRCDTGGSDEGVREGPDESLEGGERSIIASSGGGRRASEYESATMQIVEELQESLRGVVAQVAAAIETAGELFRQANVSAFSLPTRIISWVLQTAPTLRLSHSTVVSNACTQVKELLKQKTATRVRSAIP